MKAVTAATRVYIETTEQYQIVLNFQVSNACGIIRQSDDRMLLGNATPKDVGDYLAEQNIEVSGWLKTLLV